MQSVRIDNFQVARGVACLMVLLNHVGGYLVASDVYESSVLWRFMVPFGFPWVWLFLTLSGFLLTKAFTQHRFELNGTGILAFYRNRAFRLLPLLWTLCILWLVLPSIGLWSTNLPQPQFARELRVAIPMPWLPYSSYHPIASANSPVWSAVIEIHFCLLMPLLLMSSQRIVGWLLALWTFGMFALAGVVLATGSPAILGFFVTGMMLALKAPPYWIARIPAAVPIMGLALAILTTQAIGVANLNASLAVAPLIVLPAAAMLIVT